ncbi:MAG TPA: hypothetical protein V6D21_10835, partial [Candidatus Obscuribacterales bacterium]
MSIAFITCPGLTASFALNPTFLLTSSTNSISSITPATIPKWSKFTISIASRGFFIFLFVQLLSLLFYIKNSPNHYMAIIWAFIYYNLIGNSIGLNICGMW